MIKQFLRHIIWNIKYSFLIHYNTTDIFANGRISIVYVLFIYLLQKKNSLFYYT